MENKRVEYEIQYQRVGGEWQPLFVPYTQKCVAGSEYRRIKRNLETIKLRVIEREITEVDRVIWE